MKNNKNNIVFIRVYEDREVDVIRKKNFHNYTNVSRPSMVRLNRAVDDLLKNGASVALEFCGRYTNKDVKMYAEIIVEAN